MDKQQQQGDRFLRNGFPLVLLSSAVERTPGCFTKKRTGTSALQKQKQKQKQNAHVRPQPCLAVSSQGINKIDSIHKRFLCCQTLLLGGNSLSKLEGLHQFRQLKCLSLDNNLIVDFSELFYLHDCMASTLTELSLKGNEIVTNTPNFRLHVLRLFPLLQCLNGVPVSAEEKELSKSFVEKENTVLALMFSNDCLTHKLKRCIMLLRVHSEMREKYFHGQFWTPVDHAHPYAPFQLQVFLRLWDYERTIVQSTRLQVYRRIRQAVSQFYTILKSKRKTLVSNHVAQHKMWNAAYMEYMVVQQGVLTKLMTVCESYRVQSLQRLKTIERKNWYRQEIEDRQQRGKLADYANYF